MYQWQPGKWLQFAVVGVGLPYIASAWLSTDSLVSDVSTRAAAAIGGDWAKLKFDGRDATLAGEAASQDAMDSAIKAVQGTYGVRLVNTDALKVVVAAPAPLPLVAPVIAEIKADPAAAPEIKGTWPEGQAKTLDVTVNGKTYSLGKDPELTSSGGNWDLKLPAVLPAGSYDVTAVAGDGASVSSPAAQPGKLVVEAPPAPAPQPLIKPTLVPAAADAPWPHAIMGTWPEGIATSLSVGLAGIIYQLGKNPELTSDGKGNFTLQPPANLKPGTYDLDVKAADDKDQTISVNYPAAVVVPAAVPAPPAPLAAPTVDAPVIEAGKPVVLSGTWPAGAASNFSVTINGQPHKLGTDFDLLSDASGKWTLKPKEDLAPGHYDVVVEAADEAGQKQQATASFDIPSAPAPVPAPPAPLAAPTLDSPVIEAGKPVVLSGTWPAGAANTFSVTINGQPHKLGTDFDLLSDASGKWTLKPKEDLAPGHYDVVVEAADEAGQKQQATASFDIPNAPAKPAPVPAPAAATVDQVTSDSDHPVVKGTWPVGNGNTLQVELDGVTHTLGKDTDLLSDTAGHWTLKPANPVVNGTYDVVAKVTGADGQATVDTSKGELTVNVAPPAPAPPPAEAYDCEGTLAKVAAVFPIRFEFDHADLGPKYQQALMQYSALLNDPRCTALKLQVAGHADYLGPGPYNQGLSERRAKTVVGALAAAKVDADRLAPIGYGATKPLDPAHSNDARAKNRRVEFSIEK